MPVVDFDVRGAGKVTSAFDAIKEKTLKNQQEILNAVRQGNKQRTTLDRTAAEERIKIANKAFGVIARSERKAATDRQTSLAKQNDAVRNAGRVVDRVGRLNESRQEKLNRKIGETTAAFRIAGASPKLLQQEIRRLKMGYAEAELSRKRTFGRAAITEVASYARSFLGVTAVLGVVTRQFSEIAAERERIGGQQRAAKFGLGELSQLAATEGNTKAQREAALADSLAESRTLFAAGGAENLNQAGGLVFRLKSSGLNRKDRDFAGTLRTTGAVRDIGGLAEAFSSIESNLGRPEVGTFEDFTDKALRASKIAPALANQIPLAASRAGGSAAALGLSDEFLFAATARLAKSTGSAEQGGTQLSSFLKQVEKALPKNPKLQGKTGLQLVRVIDALPDAQKGFGGILGDRNEAIQGFRTLARNADSLESEIAAITKADRQNLARETVNLPRSDSALNASLVFQTVRNERDVNLQDQASFQQLAEAVKLENRTSLENSHFIDRFISPIKNAQSSFKAFVDPERFVRESVG